MTNTVSEKGQITIPKALRARLGIRAGTQLEIREERGRLILSKAVARDSLDSVIGILRTDKGTDEVIDELQGRADACD